MENITGAHGDNGTDKGDGQHAQKTEAGQIKKLRS